MKKNKKKIRKIKRLIRKPKEWLRTRRKFAGAFLSKGRAGAMILEAVIGTQFFSRLFITLFMKLPDWYVIFASAVFTVLVAELLCLIGRLLLGSGKRSKCYFITALTAVLFVNGIAVQGMTMGPAVIMSFALVLAANIFGRCIWAFAGTRCFKQVSGYLLTAISIAVIVLYGLFYRNDNLGSSRITPYLEAAPVTEAAQVYGFDTYLQNGPYTVAQLSYGPEDDCDIKTDTIDLSELKTIENEDAAPEFFTDLICDYDFTQTPVKGQIWYPDGQTDCPVFFIVHGNHDGDVPSYLGYAYLGEYLASQGYVVISVDENIINSLGSNNDSRAILLLENMKVILGLNGQSDNPVSGLIDPDRIVIGGHSRGGEMVATAYLFNDLEAYPEDGTWEFDYHFNISGIVAIAPVVDQYMPINLPVEISDVNYLLLHGSNDQDVSDMMGEKQYNNVTFTGEGDETYFRSSVYIMGANHGQFNSLWGRYDTGGVGNGYLNTNYFIDEADQKLIARAYIRTFLDTTFGIDETYSELLRDNSSYLQYLPQTVYITNWSDSSFRSICSFDDTVDLVRGGEGNIRVDCDGIYSWTLNPDSHGFSNQGENYVLVCNWDEESDPSATVSFPCEDISEGALSFRIADFGEGDAEDASGFSYTVTLTDSNGNTITADAPVYVYPTLAVQLYKQDVLFGSYEYKHQLQTVILTPDMFGTCEGFDLTSVASITWTFDGTNEGSARIDALGVYSVYE